MQEWGLYWRASDCEELVGVTHRRLSGIDQVESATATIARFKQYKKLAQMSYLMLTTNLH